MGKRIVQCFIMFCMYLLLILLSNFKLIFKAGRYTPAPSFSKTAPLSRMSCSEGFCNTCQVLIIYFGTCNWDRTDVCFLNMLNHLLTCLQFLESFDFLPWHDINTVGAPDVKRGRMSKSSDCLTYHVLSCFVCSSIFSVKF